jgi:hypothetical protein
VLTIAVVADLRGVSPWLDGESAGHKPAGSDDGKRAVALSPAQIVAAARAAKPSTPARSKAGTSVSAARSEASTRPSACVIVIA